MPGARDAPRSTIERRDPRGAAHRLGMASDIGTAHGGGVADDEALVGRTIEDAECRVVDSAAAIHRVVLVDDATAIAVEVPLIVNTTPVLGDLVTVDCRPLEIEPRILIEKERKLSGPARGPDGSRFKLCCGRPRSCRTRAGGIGWFAR